METMKKMFEHIHWANSIIFETLEKPDHSSEPLKLFTHILHAEHIWMTRLKGLDSSHLPIWSDGDLAICEKLIKQNEEAYRAFLDKIDDTELNNVITYANSKGKAFETTIRDILTHVALHGHYHRGQINMLLRQQGAEPVQLDYIAFVR